MIGDLTDEDILGLARQAGRRVQSSYEVLDAEDISSAALEEFYRSQDKLKVTARGYIYRVIERAAYRAAAGMRYQLQVETSQYVYTPSDVRALLSEAFYRPDHWQNPTREDSLADWIEHGTELVSLIDIRDALRRLTPKQRGLIEMRFFLEEPVADRKALSEAVKRLTRLMNQQIFRQEWEERRSRRVVRPNSAAKGHTSLEGGFDRNSHEKDALALLQRERTAEPLDPAGTHFDWGS